MNSNYRVGDLVHIPQSVKLIDYTGDTGAQLVIPQQIIETRAPKIGVVTGLQRDGYVQVYCEGYRWSVKNQSVYRVSA